MRLVIVVGPAVLLVAIARLRGGSAADPSVAGTPFQDTPWYEGSVADVNLVTWGVSAAIAYFGGWIAFQTERPTAGRFLTAAGAVSSWLLVDHMLRIHAGLLPDVGVPTMTSALLALMPVLAWIALFTGEIRRTRWMLLGFATVAHQIAIVFGAYWSIAEEETIVFEELTLLAAGAWALYLTLTTRDIARSTVRAALERQPADPAHESDLVTT